MIKKILNQFTNNTIQKLGEDNRYHTVYYIEFETGHFYIGKHTSDDLNTDNYFCSSKLANNMKDNNFKYSRTILYFLSNSNDAIELETEILQNKKIYEHELCLNCYPGSPPDATGTIIISKEEKFKMINPKLLNIFLEEGWKREGVKRVWVNNREISKFILLSELEIFLLKGWILGNLNSKNRIFIIKNGERKFISKTFLEAFLSEGWEIRHNVTGTRVLKKGNKIIKVQPEFIDEKLKEGYSFSSTIEDLIYIVKDKKYKRVHPNELEIFISEGWAKGNNTSNKIYITNNIIEQRIYEDELKEYPDFKIGRLKKIYLNNGVKERRIFINNKTLIQNYIDQGFVYGKLKRTKKIKIYLVDQIKQIPVLDLDLYIKEGWTNIFNPDIHRKKSNHQSQLLSQENV